MTKNSFLFVFALIGIACSSQAQKTENQSKKEVKMIKQVLDIATFGAGCFWCVEAVFQELKGVEKVVSGYSGGDTKNPTYKEVCSGFSKHAEVAQIHFDSNVISFEELVEVFFTTHDPTTLNRQGNDSGPQYRSVIYYHDDEQKVVAERLFNEFAPKYWDDPIVTEISPFLSFWEAEKYHQNFYSDNQNYPYCRIIINPKVAKFRKMYAEKLRDGVPN